MSSQVGGYECISELFNCYICTEKLTEAAMCPHCSQVGCIACVKRWTDSKKECPHCREEITADQLIRVPIFDKLIDQLTDQQPLESPGKDMEVKMCSEHGRSLEVYCAKCNMFICHECALWGKHPGHPVEKADEHYKKQRTMIEEKLNTLKDSLKIVLNYVEQTEKKMEDLKRTHNKSANEIERAVTKMRAELEKHTKSHMRNLDAVKNRLEAQSKDIAAVSLELNAKMRSRSYSSLLTQTGELKRDIESRLEKIRISIASFDAVPSVEPLVNRIVPKYEYGTLTIHPFQARQIQGDEIFSNPLNVDGMTWKLKVYPNGHKEDTGKYLSVFIELTSGFERKANYQYSIIMLFNASEKYPHKNFQKEYESDFSDGESWGYRKFYDLSKLKDEGFLKNDTIVLQFGIRAPTYCQKYSDLNLYVQRLEQAQKTLTQKVSELQHRVENHAGPHQGGLQTSPGHSESKRALISSSHHSHSRSHTAVSHQHSYSDDFSRDIPPADSEGLKRSHHISTQHLQSHSRQPRSPSHPQRSTSHASRHSESRRSIQPHITSLQPPLPVRRRSSMDQPAGSLLQYTSMASGFHIQDDAVNQIPTTSPKVPATNQQAAAVVGVDRSDGEGFNSQPSDLEDIKLIIQDDDASESSLQTVIGVEPSAALGRHLHHAGNSQPGYEEDNIDTGHMYADNHLSSQPTSHEFEPSGVYERDAATRRDLNLSQVTTVLSTSNVKRLQKSLSDLSSLTASTTNLQGSYHLSQSVLEVSDGRKQSKGQASGTTPKATPHASVQQSTMENHRGGRRDSAPNVGGGALGLSSTVGAVLWSANGQLKKESAPLGHSGRSSSSSSINLEIL
eukprot:Em0015g1217a